MIDGEMGTEGYQHGRWCNGCNQYHGILCLCEKYSDEIKQQIKSESDRYISNLRDPEWGQKQIDNGLPVVGLMIFRTLAGLGFDDWGKDGKSI